MITQDKLRYWLHFNEETGQFHWRNINKRSKFKVGDKAGCTLANRKIQITLEKEKYYAHHLVFLYLYGYIPKEDIKHKNGDSSDNREENLLICHSVKGALTVELLEKLFYYEDGKLYKKVPTTGSFSVGDEAGHLHEKSGYVRVMINGKSYAAHRLIWMLYYKEYLDSSIEIDHINHIKHDNRISNLRKATRSQNQHNALLRLDNKTGVKGISKQGSYYSASVRSNGKQQQKAFTSLAKATEWVRKIREQNHKEFHHHGT